MPPPVPPSVKLGRRIAGIAERAAKSRPSSHVVDQLRERRLQADLAHRVFEQQPVFGLLDGVDLRADQLDAVLAPARPASASSTERFSPVWPPTVESSASGRSLRMISST